MTNQKHEQSENEKEYGKIQWFFYVIFIPFIFAIVTSIVVMTMAGIDVPKLAQKYSTKIEEMSSVFSGEDNIEIANKKISLLQKTIEEQKKEISNLKTEIKRKQSDLEGSQKEIEKLTKDLHELEEKQQLATMQLKEVVKVYETMSAKKAAAILSELPNEESLDILKTMNNEAKAAILEKMDPKKAAQLTIMLKPE
ncbi:MgtE protein [Bacillus sp. P2(2020)]|uniref:MgtE protein n=2 Tax=Calidifontibacillus erzurumensis TaxID=2741433 RepID=A0A8J8GCI9_9BACI|nr:MgtE protein [Calidifontibacillus erzurumensis]